MVDVSKDHLKVKLLWQREQTSIFGGEQNFTWRCHLFFFLKIKYLALSSTLSLYTHRSRGV